MKTVQNRIQPYNLWPQDTAKADASILNKVIDIDNQENVEPLLHAKQNNAESKNLGGFLREFLLMCLCKIDQHLIFALYGIWEDLVACKILLRGVAVICPPGKHHSENFPKSVKINQNREDFFERVRLRGRGGGLRGSIQIQNIHFSTFQHPNRSKKT